jgi:hypothetical protein
VSKAALMTVGADHGSVRHHSLPDPVRQPAGFNLASAFGVSFLLVAASHVVGLSTFWAVSLIALVVAVCSAGATWPASLGVGVIGWLFVTGFVINSLGELHVTGLSDVSRLLLLVGVAVFSTAASRRGRHASWPVNIIRPAGPAGSTGAAQPSSLLEPVAGARTAPARTATDIHR